MPYFITEDGCRLFYETHGFEPAKPVVVFLNGTMQSTLYWKAQCVALNERFRIITYDGRAQGQSELGKTELSLERHKADLKGLLEHLSIEKAHLVGLSHGAKVALAYAAGKTERVDRLVLCSVSASMTCRAKLFVKSWLQILKHAGLETMLWASLPVVFGEGFLEKKERILSPIIKAAIKRNSKDALVAHLAALTDYPPLSQITGHFGVPTLVITGAQDPFVTEQGAEQLAFLCDGRHEHLNGVGHCIPSEAPELFNEILLEFLSGA
jgi:pimeloyl-ACP methyl ester carboxylesterase